MDCLKATGYELDEVLKEHELTDEQKVSLCLAVIQQESGLIVSRALFKDAYEKAKPYELSLRKIRGFIPICYALDKDKYQKQSISKIFRALSKFISEEPAMVSEVFRKQMRLYILKILEKDII